MNDKVVVFAQGELAFLNQKKKRDERRRGFVDSLPWYKKSQQTNVILVLPKRDLSVNFSMKKKCLCNEKGSILFPPVKIKVKIVLVFEINQMNDANFSLA